jgi:serine/threonine-protein kinase HipA
MGRKPINLKLYLYANNSLVGELTKLSTGALSFQYDKDYANTPNAIPLSLSLPLREEIFKGDEVHNFFENLLPDNREIRMSIAKIRKAKSTQSFDILAAIGSDCVGAIQFLNEKIDTKIEPSLQHISVTDSEISKILNNLKFHPLGLEEDQDFRISIAGAQEKTAFLRYQGKWSRPIGSTPTTHIFKPPMGKLENGIDLSTSVDNEWLCLKICELLGLPVARAEIHKFKDQRCLVVERFDRQWKGDNKLHRIFQEDLCQALNTPSNLKYESDGGPGIEPIMELLMGSDQPHQDRLQFVRAQIVNYLLCATDGHGKNYSLFLTSGGYSMTPIYDVLSAYPAYEDRQIQLKQIKMAMAAGNKHRYKWHNLSIRHFLQTANNCGLAPREFDKIIEDIKLKAFKKLRDQIPMPTGFNKSVYESIMKHTQAKIDLL